MRVVHVVSTYPPYRSGMGNVAQRLAVELSKRGHQVTVCTPDYGVDTAPVQSTDDMHARVDVRRVRPWFTYGNSAFVPGLRHDLRDADVIHLHYPFFGGAETVAWFAARQPRAALVVTYHMDVVGTGVTKAAFSAYHRLLLSPILRQARVVLVSSADYAAHSPLLKRLPWLSPLELPFGVDDRFTPSPAVPRESRILFVSALDKAHYFKGLDVLLAALARLTSGASDKAATPRLAVVGDGDLRATYEQTAADLGIASQVDFLGSLNDADLINEYRRALVTVKPSIDRSEAFGLTTLESMACGTPAIVSDLPGMRTLVSDGTGLVVPPGDVSALSEALRVFTANKALAASRGEAAARRVNEHYRWPEIIDRLEQIYENSLRH